jgi:hypothetical protein
LGRRSLVGTAMEPLSAYGVTTSINGNCGFSLAPAHIDPAVRDQMIDIFNYFEDIPAEPQRDVLPWGFGDIRMTASWRRRAKGDSRGSLERESRKPVGKRGISTATTRSP